MVDLKLLQKMSERFTVLYVEDDILIQKEMQTYLENFFHKVFVANDGEEGLKLYLKEDIDIVITDLSMPKMNGLEMLQKIREHNKEQAVLITTAHSEADYIMKAIKLSVDGYVVKPFDYEQINQELFKIVDKLTRFAQNEEYKKHLKRMVEQKTSELNTMIHFQKENYEQTLLSMVEMIEERDTYTAGHSQRVAQYSKMIAQHMGYSDAECQKVYQAGILHDIGKVATPDVVLLKPQKLNELEYKLIQEHVVVGYKLLVNIPMFKDLAEIVYGHHERCDGSGYPRGLKKDEILDLSKIMAVADTFDAMTTNRIYKGRKSVAEALLELTSLKTTLFDAAIVDAATAVLSDVTIDTNINQLPQNEVEKERFAYFYKDMLTGLYNQNYLDVILVQNSFEHNYEKLYIFNLENFTQYNKIHGWKQGDLILQKIAQEIRHCIDYSSAFRVFGDDFVILDNGKCDIQTIQASIESIAKETEIITCATLVFELQEDKIVSTSDIEKKILFSS